MNKRIKKKKQTTINDISKQFDVIRGHRLSDGWENEEFDNAGKISNFNETLDGTFDGLMNYHTAVAGCCVMKKYEHIDENKECDNR